MQDAVLIQAWGLTGLVVLTSTPDAKVPQRLRHRTHFFHLPDDHNLQGR